MGKSGGCEGLSGSKGQLNLAGTRCRFGFGHLAIHGIWNPKATAMTDLSAQRG
jgi:hypothetical protein